MHVSCLLDKVAQCRRKLSFVSYQSEILEFSEEAKQLLMKGYVEQIIMEYSSSKQLSIDKCCHRMVCSQVIVDIHALSKTCVQSLYSQSIESLDKGETPPPPVLYLFLATLTFLTV